MMTFFHLFPLFLLSVTDGRTDTVDFRDVCNIELKECVCVCVRMYECACACVCSSLAHINRLQYILPIWPTVSRATLCRQLLEREIERESYIFKTDCFLQKLCCTLIERHSC